MAWPTCASSESCAANIAAARVRLPSSKRVSARRRSTASAWTRTPRSSASGGAPVLGLWALASDGGSPPDRAAKPTTAAVAMRATSATIATTRVRGATANECSREHRDGGRRSSVYCLPGIGWEITPQVAIFRKVMPTYRELLAETKAEIDEIGTSEAHERLAQGSVAGADAPLFLDIREVDEWQEGHIVGALHIPRGNLESRVEGLIPDKNREIFIYCAAGSRSAFAAKALGELGYSDVASVAGGFSDWKRNGYDFTTPKTLTPAQRSRYSRHLLIPEVGDEGQQKLLNARVLLIGAGGLGSPAS